MSEKRFQRCYSKAFEKKVSIALLYSTATKLDAMTLVSYSYYKARFQIECIFRDADNRLD